MSELAPVAADTSPERGHPTTTEAATRVEYDPLGALADTATPDVATQPLGGDAPQPPQDGGDRPLPPLDGRLRALLDNSEVTPAGRAFFEPRETGMLDWARNTPPEPGKYALHIHGNAAIVAVGTERFSADDFATMVRHDPNHDGSPLKLYSCETGRDDDGFAQQLADRLGVDVEAPDKLAFTWADGRTVVASLAGTDINGMPIPTQPADGLWRLFHPRT